MKIIILSINQYKEKDAIISSMSSTGKLTFIVKALYDPKSRNSQLNSPLTIIDAEFVEGEYQYPVLKRFMVVSSPMKNSNDYEYLSSILILGEISNKLVQEEDYSSIYEWLYNGLEKLDKTKTYYSVLLIYIANVLKVSGYEFEVNKCVMCGSKKSIAAFSFDDGGFLCTSCLNEDVKSHLNKKEMILIREIFNTTSYNINEEICKKDDAISLLFKFYTFISDSFSTKINNILMLNK